MKIENIDKVEELIAERSKYAEFCEAYEEAVDDYMEQPTLMGRPYISIQVVGSRRCSKLIKVPYDSELGSALIYSVRSTQEVVEEELKEL